MSFWPLPTTLVEPLVAASRRGPLVELGSGGGEFTRRLESLGLAVIEVDQSRPASGRRCFVNAELARLPFAPASLGGVVLANTLRHVPSSRWPDVAAEAHQAVQPGGVALVLEDDPAASTPAQENYRRVLALLARFDPRRGCAVEREACLRAWRARWDQAVIGEGMNEESVRDPLAPIRWLQARRPHGDRGREVNALAAAVQESGMAYGRFWFCVFRKGDARA